MSGTTGGFLEEMIAQRCWSPSGNVTLLDEDMTNPSIAPRVEALAAMRDRLRRDPWMGMCVIAEIKRSSPSRGVFHARLDPGQVAREYEQAGATAVSVLTEPKYFGGTLQDLWQVRNEIGIPVLRKDFIVDMRQLEESRRWGADLVLLIVSVLQHSTARFVDRARELGMEPLVEVHDERELGVALESGATMVGVNNRNLRTLTTDLDVSRRLLPQIPTDRQAVCESGLRTRDDLLEMATLGARAFLVGEALMGASSPGEALAALIGPRIHAREGREE